MSRDATGVPSEGPSAEFPARSPTISTNRGISHAVLVTYGAPVAQPDCRMAPQFSAPTSPSDTSFPIAWNDDPDPVRIDAVGPHGNSGLIRRLDDADRGPLCGTASWWRPAAGSGIRTAESQDHGSAEYQVFDCCPGLGRNPDVVGPSPEPICHADIETWAGRSDW